MARRPVFVTDDVLYVKTVNTEFKFYNGLSKAQKQRSSESLHEAFKSSYADANVLEVSSFSNNPLGNKLSAFNLLLSLKDGTKIPVEAAFQGGKIFENGGPYKDLLKESPKNAKRDDRLRMSGRIVGFEFEGMIFPTDPLTLFYTWLYLHALKENKEIASELLQFDAFTDIAFNPQKSINCQAYACAVYVTLQRKSELEKALTDVDFLSEILKKGIGCVGVRERKEVTGPKIRREPVSVPVNKDAGRKPVFKIGDIITHPKYGEGIIKCTEAHGTADNLVIRFESIGEEKKLSAAWVKDHCKYAMQDQQLFEKISLKNDPEDSARFEYYQSTDAPFTEAMKASIFLAEKCFDNAVSFAVLGDHVMLVLTPADPSDFREIKKIVEKRCGNVLSAPPDFETAAVEDKAFLVVMGENLMCIVPNKTGAEKLDFGEALVHRQEILEACEKKQLYGFAKGRRFT